jgi:hypothetical protein
MVNDAFHFGREQVECRSGNVRGDSSRAKAHIRTGRTDQFGQDFDADGSRSLQRGYRRSGFELAVQA